MGVGESLDEDGEVSRAAAGEGDPAEHAQAVVQLHESRVRLQLLQAELLGAYHSAVAAFDAAGARAIAAQIVAGLQQATKAAGASENGQPAAGHLAALRASFAQDVHKAIASLAVQLSPQMLAWFPVTATIEPPSLGKVVHVGVALVAHEAAMVVQLLEAADRIVALARPHSAVASLRARPEDLQRAVDEFERFQARPVHVAFLAEVLKRRRVWSVISQARSSGTERSAAHLLHRAQAQATETGTTADVGAAWDLDQAQERLTYGATDWAVTDEDALQVIEMLRQASPEARSGLVKQLHKRGLLSRLAENVGWQHIKAVAETLDDPEAEALLAPYWEGKGGVPSLGQLLTKRVKDNRQAGGWLNATQAFAWETLNTSLDVFTLGAKPALDSAHETLDAGWISADAYGVEASKAQGRALLTGAAMAASGGVAGAWTEGAALMLGAGEGGAALLGAAAGGAVGNVGGQLAGDLFDQTFSGKPGFDSFSSYAQTFAQGGALGAAMAPVSLAGAKYLPATMRTVAQQLAAAHPEMVHFLEAAKMAGAGAAFRVRVTVREWIAITKSGGPGMFNGGLQPVLATAGLPADLSSWPPDAELWITARPKVELNTLASRLGDRAPYFDLDSIDAEPRASHRARSRSGSLFDDHGGRATYTDDPFEHRHEIEPSPRATDADTDASHVLAERGTTPLSGNRLGIHRTPRHHLLPQKRLAYFQERGFEGRDIDNFCVELAPLEHDMIHGGNQRLARVHWKEQEWNTRLFDTLDNEEKALRTLTGDAKARLSRESILFIMEKQRRDFGLSHLPLVKYHD